MKRWIGIDPGADGAIAMIPEQGEIEIYELNDDNLISLLRSWKSDDCICCLEQVASSPQMGVKSAFSFAEGYGGIKMCLKCHSISFETVTPQKWKKEFGCYLGKEFSTKQKKDKDIEVCKRLYPNINLRRTDRCKTDSDGYADAILMATYAKRRM